jgi:hypothetical protein
MDLKKISCKGLQAKADIGLYQENSSNKESVFISFYAPVQIVKGINSRFATFDPLEVEGIGEIHRPNSLIRFRGFPFGYGRAHGLIWSDDVGKKIIFTFGDRLQALERALAPRKVPYLREWLPWMYDIFLQKDLIEELPGWGGVSGIRLTDKDDDICTAITDILAAQRVLKKTDAGHKKAAAKEAA